MVSSGFDRSLAIVIGINDYSNGIPSLQSARVDAEAIADIFETQYQYQVIRLTDTTEVKPTLESIKQLLEQKLPTLLSSAEATRLVFYFAGHGIALNGEDGPEGYLIPQDAQLGNVQTYLPMTEVHTALLQLSCRHFLGILDCCFAGAFRWSSTRKLIPVELGTIHKERFDRFIHDPAWQVITSASYDQTALDAFTLKDDRGQAGIHSPFAAALIEALQGKADAYPPAEPPQQAGDGIITATELYLYLRDQVEIPTEARAIRQTPGIYPLKKHDKGEYIFLTPGHELNLPPAPPLDVSKNPYRGLEAFEEEHHDLFFGRKALTDELYKFVSSHSLTVVLGSSGSGKSSLVKAGLLPEFRQCKNETSWFILPPFRPGESPFKSLNSALTSVKLPEIGSSRNPASELFTTAQGLKNWLKDHSTANLLVVVDQFEELITLCRDEQERQLFLEALRDAITAYPDRLHLIITLRSDFEPQFRNTALEPYWQEARFIVPAMMREELRQAIEEPASARVMYFNPHALVDQLIDEVANMPGALPLLSFALSELYLKYLKRQEEAKHRGETIDRAITQADYKELGGVTRSLTQRADQEYKLLVKQDPAYAQTIRHVMLRMVAIGDDFTRRRVLLSELKYSEPENTRAKTIIQHFLDVRLLTSDIDNECRSYVEPAHDALVRGWQRLISWKQEAQETLILQRRLTPAAEEWQNQQKARYLWNTNPRLDLLRQILHSSDSWFNQTETEFVTRSIEQRRRNKLIRWGLVILAFVTLSSFTAFILLQLIRTDLREKSARVENLLQSNPVEGLLLAIQAIGQNRSQLPWEIQVPVESSLLNAVQTARESDRFIQQFDFGEANDIEAVAISPNGQMIATINALGGIVSLWDLNGNQIAQLAQEQGNSTSIAFSPNGNIVIGSDAMQASPVKFWNIDGSIIPLPFKKATSLITTATFTSDGQKIITGSDDGQLRLWDTQGNPLTESFGEQGSRITAITMSSDGKTLASGDETGIIQLWTPEGTSLGELPQTQEKSSLITSIQFSSDSQKMLIRDGSGDGSRVFLWCYQGNQWIGSVLEQSDAPDSGTFTTTAAFSADGRGIITGHTDGHIRMWQVPTRCNDGLNGKPIDEFLSGNISGIVLTPYNKNVITTSVNGVVKIWDLKPGDLVEELLPGGQRGDFTSLISSDGHGFVTSKVVGQDVVIQFWNFRNNQIQRVGKEFRKPLEESRIGYLNVNLLSLSADQQRILIGDPNGNIRVWDASGTARSELVEGNVYKAALSPDGQRIITGYFNLQLWNLDGKMLDEKPLELVDGESSNIIALAISPDGSTIATANGEAVCIWQLKGDILTKQTCKVIAEPSALAFSPDSKVLGIGSKQGILYLWHLTNNQLSPGLQIHLRQVTAIAFSPDGQRVVSGDRDGGIQLSTAQAVNIGKLNLLQDGSIGSLAFSPDGNTVISSGFDGGLRLHQVNWNTWLKTGCNRLRYHPVLENPTTDEQQGVRAVCQTYVWNQE